MPGTEPHDESDVESQISAIAALNEPVRRDLYRYAVSQPVAISRDDAAREIGISRELAAFHLDKLVDVGMLDVEYRRVSGRQGPGAGRPAKLYYPSARQLEVSFPDRRYELAGDLLAEALEDEAGDPAAALDRVARRFGEELGAGVRRYLGRRPSVDRLLRQAATVLQSYGFEPLWENGQVVLRNCPFGALAREHRNVICGMNLRIVEGLIAGLGTAALEAGVATEPGRCCVVLGPVRRRSS